jgi:RND family efflux transporter MFP subunit
MAIKAIDTAREAYNVAKAAAATQNAAIATLQATLAAAEKSITDTVIRAPISGFVSEKVADVGEYISPSVPNSKIATIVRTSTLRMKIDIPEASVGKVATGQGISLQTSTYPDRSFAGTIVRIAPGLNTTARTLTVEAEVQNVDGLLKPGQFATVRITQSKPEPAVVIPARAVKTAGDINSVFVITEGIAPEQFGQLGLLEGDKIQAKSGLIDGDRVAVTNIEQLRDGILVRQ